ncbi:DNA ligase (ATP) [Maudiozyma humilis]|uniref:DNA ligase n=1 Tax=Maudiozyma humilis TaxID=51915 RepID=A0AAV5RUI3_MAUHU|nr:DNA ligase (ATP) [Kazachstania humilis]
MDSKVVAQNNEPVNFSPSPDFRWLCDELFVKIDNIIKDQSKSNSKTKSTRYFEVIEHFVKLWRLTVGNDIYPALRLILPYRDTLTFNIKDVVLIKAICIYLHLPKDSLTERRLLHWKEHASKNEGLSDFCVSELRKRRDEGSSNRDAPHQERVKNITIDELNSKLEALANERNTKGRGYKNLSESPIFRYFLEHMSFVELKYLFNILLRNKVIGGLEHKLLYCWHPDARDYLSVVSDIRLVTQKLWDPSVRLGQDDLTLHVGQAFYPQLARRANTSYATLCKNLKNDFFIEEKMDGERIQVHYMDYGNNIKFFSRRGTDYTHLYGNNISCGTIAKYLQLDSAVKNCVLDGEVVTYDTERGVVLPFGIVKSSAKDMLANGDISGVGFSPMFVAFDLLTLNGVNLTESPIYQRKDYLSKVLQPTKHHVEIIHAKRSDNEIDIKESLVKVIDLGCEGVILKRAQSKYILGSRSDSWIKIKPEYLEEFGENMDLLVMGRDPGKKDSFLCGLVTRTFDEYDVKEHGDASNNSVVGNEHSHNPLSLVCVTSFCSIANGLSLEDIKEINAKTRGSWVRSDDHPPPSDILKFGTKVPVEWIHPQQSIVLEVKARSLDNTESSGTKYEVGCTLFFAYCRQVRYDKDWRSCYSLNDFQQDRERKKHPNEKNLSKMVKKSPVKRTKNYGILDLGVKLPDKNLVVSDLFNGLYFYVLSDSSSQQSGGMISKENIIDAVMQNGGTMVHNIIARHFPLSALRIIGDKMTRECILLIGRGYDILSSKWVFDCIKNKEVVQIGTQHCFNASKELVSLAGHRVDKFNDSYTIPTDISSVDHILESNREKSLPVSPQVSMDKDLYALPYFLFTTRVILVIPTKKNDSQVFDICEKVKLFGGKITEDMNQCNLIVITNTCSNGLEDTMRNVRHKLAIIAQKQPQIPQIPHIVTSNWVDDSIEANSQVPEEDYVPISNNLIGNNKGDRAIS